MADLVPRVRCPVCFCYPNERITRVTKRIHRRLHADELVKTVRCKCGTVYEVRAWHYASAFLDAPLDAPPGGVYPST